MKVTEPDCQNVKAKRKQKRWDWSETDSDFSYRVRNLFHAISQKKKKPENTTHKPKTQLCSGLSMPVITFEEDSSYVREFISYQLIPGERKEGTDKPWSVDLS